jgi:hypothetical protein
VTADSANGPSKADKVKPQSKIKMKNLLKPILLVASSALVTTAVQASTDYGPAIWNPPCNANWYTSGSGHKFHVIHDMEGYYASVISMFNSCSYTSASVHYLTNGKKDATSDAAAGEITQMVRDANYAWHALCWNTHSTGTEHEGFVSNPAWYTEAQYVASAGISAHLASHFGYAKDRNHIVGHNAKSSSAWVTYANNNLGINATCNSHTDPGANWNWSHYMDLVNGGGGGGSAVIVDNTSAGFSASTGWATSSSAPNEYGSNYRYHSTAAVSDAATWTANVTAGSHTVYVWYPEGSNRSTVAPFIISTSGGSHTEYVNQQITGGQWVNQGTYSMSGGNNTVDLSCWAPTGFVVVADAVKWQ